MTLSKGVIGIILILLIITVSGFVIATQLPTDTYKLRIEGNASYNVITGWGVSYSRHEIERDKGFFSVLGWYWPWETKDIHIVVKLTGDGKTYQGENWLGTISSIYGTKEFGVEIRHVSSGSYSGEIRLYEVEKGMFFGESNRVLQATTNFMVNI